MGYTLPPRDAIEQLTNEIRELWRQVSELQRPDGSQLSNLLQVVKDLIASVSSEIATSVTNYLASGFTSTGRATLTGGITSADVKSRTLSVGYDAVYIDVNNIMGKSPSARRFKQDIESHRWDPAVLDELDGVTFRLIGAVEVLGDEAKVEHGFIAEQLEEIGLGAFVSYDTEGQPAGIAYERLTVPLVSAVQDLRARLAALEARL